MTVRSKHRMICVASVQLLLVASATSTSAQLKRTLELEDYYRINNVGSPAISPDGQYVAYPITTVREDENDRHSEIWLASTDGVESPRRLTGPGADASNPQWTPDGSMLAFTSNRQGGNGESNVWFLRMDGAGGEAFQIDGLGGWPLFNPNNRTVAFTKATPPPPAPPPVYESEFERKTVERFDGRIYDWMNYRFDRRGYLPDPRDPRATPPDELYVVDRNGGEPSRLTNIGVDVADIAWGPDGNALAFIADEHQRDEMSYERADVWVVNVNGEVTRLTNDEFNYRSPAWSPDGQWIAVRGNEGLDVIIREDRERGAPIDLFMLRSGGSGTPINLTSSWDLMPGAPSWSPDGRHVYFVASVSGTSHLFRVRVDDHTVEQITTGDRMLNAFSYSSDFRRMAYRATEPTSPGDIFTRRPDGDDERRVSAVNDDLLTTVELVSPERIRYYSNDGTPIEGWIMTPPGYDSTRRVHPMVLTIHGGPHGAYGNSFMFEQQLLAANGYVVLYTNPRASTGYGEDFRWGTWGGWGFKDYEDLMAGVDYAVANYQVDTTRMGVTGYSYGGFMTNMVITRTNRFAAAIAGASISNWVSDYGVADIPRTKESEFFGPPWEQRSRDLLMRSSPIMYAGNVTTPTMFVHGEYDHRVPIEEAEQMYVALKKLGVDAKFVRYPESYHGGWTPWRYVHRMYIQLDWWDRYLAEQPTSEEGER